MKKIAVMLIALFFVASSAYAATGTVAAGTEVNDTGSGDSIAKLSSSVSLGWNMTTVSYAIATQHVRGTRVYGTAAGDTKINVTAPADGVTAATAPTAVDSSAFSSWTEL